MASLASRLSYLNFFLAATLGLMFWYRGLFADKPLGIFLLLMALIFLFQTGISDTLSKDTGYRLMIFGLWLALFGLNLSAFLTIKDYSFIPPIISGILFLYFSYIAITSESCNIGYSEWSSGCNYGVYYFLLFISLFYLSYVTKSLSLLVLIFAGFILSICNSNMKNAGYFLMLSLLFVLSINWFVPFFYLNCEIEKTCL